MCALLIEQLQVVYHHQRSRFGRNKRLNDVGRADFIGRVDSQSIPKLDWILADLAKPAPRLSLRVLQCEESSVTTTPQRLNLKFEAEHRLALARPAGKEDEVTGRKLPKNPAWDSLC